MKRPNRTRLETGKFGFKAELIKLIAETFPVSADVLPGIDKSGREDGETGVKPQKGFDTPSVSVLRRTRFLFLSVLFEYIQIFFANRA